MNDFNNTVPVKLDPITVKMIENRVFRNWQEPNILKINSLVAEFAGVLSEKQFTNILTMNGQSLHVAEALAKAAYEAKDDVDYDFTTGAAEGINIARAIDEELAAGEMSGEPGPFDLDGFVERKRRGHHLHHGRHHSDHSRVHPATSPIPKEAEVAETVELSGEDHNILHDTLASVTETVKSWNLQDRFKKVCDTVSEHASKASDSVQEAAKSKSIQFVKKHGATITVTLLCRRFGLSPEVAQEIISLFKD